MKFKKLKNMQLSEAVANEILSLIEKGSLKAGDKLPTEKELELSLGVSRTAIREGMQRLKMVNILEVRPGQGTFIKDTLDKKNLKSIEKESIYNRKTLIEIIELRKIIEIGIIDVAIDRMNENDLKTLGSCIDNHEKGLIKGVFPAEGDMSFHRALAKSTHNNVLIDFFDDIYLLVFNIVIGVDNYQRNYKKALEFHKDIYNSLLRKDKDSAKKHMEGHLDWLIKVISEDKA